MELAIRESPTARDVLSIDAGRVLGIVRGPRATEDPQGSHRWTLTRDLGDLSQPDADFLPCEDATGARRELEARFPSPHPELSRLATLESPRPYHHKRQRYVEVSPETWIVFLIPRLAHVFVGSGGYSSHGHASVARLLDLAAAIGPFLITRECAEQLRGLESFAESDLVIAQESGCHHATLKFAPSKSQARRTRAANIAAKQTESSMLAKAAARMRDGIEDLARAIRQDLEAFGLAAALPEMAPSLHDEEEEPAGDASHRRGRGWRSGYAAPQPPRRQSLEILHALCQIHSRFRGRFTYRRLPAWETLRSEFRTRPPALEPERWGLHNGREDLRLFWSREMEARRPKR